MTSSLNASAAKHLIGAT